MVTSILILAAMVLAVMVLWVMTIYDRDISDNAYNEMHDVCRRTVDSLDAERDKSKARDSTINRYQNMVRDVAHGKGRFYVANGYVFYTEFPEPKKPTSKPKKGRK
jgi:hypothetical protein